MSVEPEVEGEILFVVDRRPGVVDLLPAFQKSVQSDSPEGSEYKTEQTQEAFKLSGEEVSSDGESRHYKYVDSEQSIKEEKSTCHKSSEDTLFVIEDRTPNLTGGETKSPRYNINENYLRLQNPQPASKQNRIANTCWNCGETSHALRDCPHPRDHKQIAKSRKEFQDAKGCMPVYKRYHVEDNQRFGQLVPGKLSVELRRALGLEPRQLPTHIYMMRRLGYPPGWLQEASISHSGISMFDGKGKEVSTPGTDEGEVLKEGKQDNYDIRKIVHYPGFNVPAPSDTYDDSSYWRCPPQSRLQSVEVMLERLGGRMVGAYKRRKLDNNSICADDSSQSAESYDMDYEEIQDGVELPEDNCKFVPPLPDVELPPPPPSELPEPLDIDSQLLQPSLVEDKDLSELEEQKKLLLAQLNDVSPLCSTPESRVGKVKSVDLGTPILKSVSPYRRLPSVDKFSVNICDVINFENLPDSTGKYEQMSGLIRKVRTKLNKINNDL